MSESSQAFLVRSARRHVLRTFVTGFLTVLPLLATASAGETLQIPDKLAQGDLVIGLHGPQAQAQVLLDNLPGYPDNLTRAPSGRIWVGMTKPRSDVLDFGLTQPWTRKLIVRLPRALWPVPQAYGHIFAFEDSGRIVDDLQDPKGGYPETTSATEVNGRLFVQSLNATSLAWLPYRGPGVPVPAEDDDPGLR